MQGLLILFPVFGGEKAAAKIRTVKGLRVEIFSRCARKNTTRPLTVWIVGADEFFSSASCKSDRIIHKTVLKLNLWLTDILESKEGA